MRSTSCGSSPPALPPSSTSHEDAVSEDDRSNDADGAVELFRRLPDPAVREELVERYFPLARHLARRFVGRGETIDDLIQVADLGLLNAIDRFDPDRGVQF